MISGKQRLVGKLSAKNNLNGKLNNATIKVYPQLEDLEVIPSGEEQNFKSNKYGYNNVKVKAVESKELNIVPSTENQVKEGLFNKVTVEGDSELLPENIKKGVRLFEVEGTANTTNLKITDASYLFYSKSRLDYLEELLSACENVSDTSHMFDNCYATPLELDLSNFDTSNVTNMEYMFNQCSQFNILGLSNFNTSNVTNMRYMFCDCTSITELDLSNFNISNVTSMERMFHSCSNLTKLNLNNLNAEKVKSVQNFLTSVRGLIELNFMNNLGKGYTQKTINYSAYKLDLSKCTELTHESSMNVINNLYDLNLTYNVANGGTLYTQSLVLGENVVKLTPEEIAIATSKGWSVAIQT